MIAVQSVLARIFRNRRKSLLIRLITSIILIAVFNVAVIGISSFKFLSSRFNKEIERFNIYKLTQIMETIENGIFLPADMLAIELALNNSANETIHFLLENPFRQNYSYIPRIQNSLTNSLLTISEKISSISIYYPENDIIVSSDSGVKFLNSTDRSSVYYYEWVDLFRDDMGGENSLWLKARIALSPYDLSRASDILTIVRTIPLRSQKDSYTGLIAVNIDESKIAAELQRHIHDEYSSALIVMPDGTIVASGSTEDDTSGLLEGVVFSRITGQKQASFVESIAGENIVVTSITSGYNGWHYIYAIPEKYFSEQTSLFGKVLLAICSISLVFIMIMSSLISVKLTTPIRKLMRRSLSILKGKGYAVTGQGDLQAIETTITTLSNRLTDLEQVLEKNREVMVANFYYNLLHGRISSSTEIAQRLQFLEKEFKYAFFVVFVLRFSSRTFDSLLLHESETILYDSAERTLAECQDLFYSIEDRYSIVYVLNHPSTGRKEMRQFAARLCRRAASDYQIKTECGIGGVCSELKQIERSFAEAKDSMEYAFVRPDELVFDHDETISLDKGEFFEVESINLTDISTAAATLHKIKESIVEDRLPPAHAKKIIASIALSLKRQSLKFQTDTDRYDIPTTADRADEFADIDEAFNFLEGIANRISDEIEKRKKSRNGLYAQQAVEYIQNHIAEDISLDIVSELVGISPSHFSRIFKNTTNEGLVSYITRTRMSKAAFSLLHADKSIKTIAAQTGFKDYSYFCKIFKQHFSMTPGDYRRSNRRLDKTTVS